MPPSLAAAALAAAALALAGCAGLGGDEEAAPPPPETLPPADPGPVHIHALAVEPGSGTLLVGTHTGLFRAEAPGDPLSRVVGSAMDMLALAAVDEASLIASGHPPQGATDVPPQLGLLVSTDGGSSWDPISLAGEVTFRLLRGFGGTVYGLDENDRRFRLSRNGGATWVAHVPPPEPFDVVHDPADAEHLVATAADGIYATANAGRTWERIGDATGFLAWPLYERLVAVAEDGTVRVSDDEGATFAEVGDVGGTPVALAATERDLFVALDSGEIRRSADGGATWTLYASRGIVG